MRKKEEILASESHSDRFSYFYDDCYDGSRDIIFNSMSIHAREMAIEFLDSIREYEHESGDAIWLDERSSSELFEIFLAKIKEDEAN